MARKSGSDTDGSKELQLHTGQTDLPSEVLSGSYATYYYYQNEETENQCIDENTFCDKWFPICYLKLAMVYLQTLNGAMSQEV